MNKAYTFVGFEVSGDNIVGMLVTYDSCELVLWAARLKRLGFMNPGNRLEFSVYNNRNEEVMTAVNDCVDMLFKLSRQERVEITEILAAPAR